MRLKEKFDGFLLLSIYFVPLLVVLSWALNVGLFLMNPFERPLFINMTVLLAVYSTLGGLAPFFEVGVGAYMDRRGRALWLIPLLILLIPVNVAICVKAFFDVGVSKMVGNNNHKWRKTCHNGNGNCYISNQCDKIE